MWWWKNPAAAPASTTASTIFYRRAADRTPSGTATAALRAASAAPRTRSAPTGRPPTNRQQARNLPSGGPISERAEMGERPAGEEEFRFSPSPDPTLLKRPKYGGAASGISVGHYRSPRFGNTPLGALLLQGRSQQKEAENRTFCDFIIYHVGRDYDHQRRCFKRISSENTEGVTAVTAGQGADRCRKAAAPAMATRATSALKALFLWNPKPFLFEPAKRNGVGPASAGGRHNSISAAKSKTSPSSGKVLFLLILRPV